MYKTYSNIVPTYQDQDLPLVFSSTLCREQHFHLPLYQYWCNALKEQPRLHRKQWEFVYICQSLYERGALREGATALGFGVGREPLVSLFASLGLNVIASDLDFESAKNLGWVDTEQHSSAVSDLNERAICDADGFLQRVSFTCIDMNEIPSNLDTVDVCWSSCAFEHLGSIKKGLDFVLNSSQMLKPGGIAVHTTEFNLSSNTDTLDNNPAFVIFRQRDIEELAMRLSDEGFILETVNYSGGSDELENYVDLPPYLDEPHLRLELAGKYACTSIGLIVHRPQ